MNTISLSPVSKLILFSLVCILFALVIFFSSRPSGAFFEIISETKDVNKPLSPMTTDRGRVKVCNNTVVSDNGVLLRGESIHLAGPNDSSYPLMTHLYNLSTWQILRDKFFLNTIRLIIYRPPQNWENGPGKSCRPPIYRCYDLDYLINDPHSVIDVIDDVVDIASVMGMYLILDYHPVGGIDETDATKWWTIIAPRYKDRTHVIYELANEPVAWSAASYNKKSIQLQEKLYNLIRSFAPDTHIILWSFANARGPMLEKVKQAQNVSYGNASVGFHSYGYENKAVEFLRNEYPVINTEIGADQNRLSKTRHMEKIGVSWVWLGGTRPNISNGKISDAIRPDDIFWSADEFK